MKSKVLLIRPANIYNYNNYPPLGLISIGSKLKAAGYDVRIINSALEENALAAIAKELEGALFAGISLLTSEIPDAYRIMKFIKDQSDVPVVVGGWHCTLFPEQMAECEYVDYVVAGEGEEHIIEIAETIRSHKQRDGKIFHQKITDLDGLPVPDYDLDKKIEFFISNYLTDKLSGSVQQPMRWLPYETSRGCPSQCTFCINVVTGNMKYRKKSAKKVIDEIEYLVNKYDLTHVKIIDDNFFVDINRVREICKGIIGRGIHVTWDGECRCDYFNERHLNDETLALAKRSGLVQLTLGIESGSQQTLNIMKKGIKVAQAEFAVKKCDEFGIIARSSFIVEIPGESLDDIKKTLFFINRMRKYPLFTSGMGTFRPYPKCELTTSLLKDGHLKEPQNFREWTDKEIIDLYTSAEQIRPWQVNGAFSEAASYYQNMESAVRLGNYQIGQAADRWKNNIFIFLARIRNKFMFYKFPIDKKLYQKFLKDFYEQKQILEKKKAGSLGKDKNGKIKHEDRGTWSGVDRHQASGQSSRIGP